MPRLSRSAFWTLTKSRIHREGEAVGLAGRRVDRRRSGRDDVLVLRAEVDQRIRRDDEIAVRIDRLAGADDRVPIAGRPVLGLVLAGGVAGAREEVRDEDRVRA